MHGGAGVVYRVELSNGAEVTVDGVTGAIIRTEASGAEGTETPDGTEPGK